MRKSDDLELAGVGDDVDAVVVMPLGRATVAVLYDDGSVGLERKQPGRYIEKDGGTYVQLGGARKGEFVVLPYIARPEQLADGTIRYVVNSPSTE